MNSTNSCLWWRSKELNSSSVLRYCVHVHQFVIENPPVGLLTTTITHQLMEEDSLQVNSMYPSVSCTCSCKAVEEQGIVSDLSVNSEYVMSVALLSGFVAGTPTTLSLPLIRWPFNQIISWPRWPSQDLVRRSGGRPIWRHHTEHTWDSGSSSQLH